MVFKWFPAQTYKFFIDYENTMRMSVFKKHLSYLSVTALSFKTVRKSLVLVCKIIIFAHSDAGSTA